MAASSKTALGTIGAGTIGQAIAAHTVAAGYHVVLSNSRGPESLSEIVDRLGPNAAAGTVIEAAAADIVLLAVGWDDVPDAAKHVPDWTGRIVIDATNQWHQGPGSEVDLGDQTGSERNAALMPGARVVKAFNTIFGSVVAKDPRHADGSLVVFLAGDDAEAKSTVAAFVESIGFAPVDIGGVQEGRLMQVGAGPLVGLHAVKLG
jgi:8-hydroxy-5-deazaflavin:NADPH oxidoreductase